MTSINGTSVNGTSVNGSSHGPYTNGTHKKHVNGKTYKIADQLNGATNHMYPTVDGTDGDVAPSVSRAIDDANNLAHNGHEKVADGARRAAAQTKSLIEKAKETVGFSIGLSLGLAKSAASVYYNGTVAVVGYSAATAAHAARVSVNTTAGVVGYGAGVASAVVDYGLQAASKVAHYAADTGISVVDRGAGVANVVAHKVLPTTYHPHVDMAAELASKARQDPVGTAKHVLPAPVYDQLAWGVDTINSTKDHTVQRVQNVQGYVVNTGKSVVDNTVSKLRATEDFAYDISAKSYGSAKKTIQDVVQLPKEVLNGAARSA